MSYYVSAIDGQGRKALLCGPFRQHGDAMRNVHLASKAAERLFRDADHFSTAYGTCHHRTGHPTTAAVQAVNSALGLSLDAQGFVRN